MQLRLFPDEIISIQPQTILRLSLREYFTFLPMKFLPMQHSHFPQIEPKFLFIPKKIFFVLQRSKVNFAPPKRKSEFKLK